MGRPDLIKGVLKRRWKTKSPTLLAWKKANPHFVTCLWGYMARNHCSLQELSVPQLITNRKWRLQSYCSWRYILPTSWMSLEENTEPGQLFFFNRVHIGYSSCLLKHNWHLILHQFQVYNIMIQYLCTLWNDHHFFYTFKLNLWLKTDKIE